MRLCFERKIRHTKLFERDSSSPERKREEREREALWRGAKDAEWKLFISLSSVFNLHRLHFLSFFFFFERSYKERERERESTNLLVGTLRRMRRSCVGCFESSCSMRMIQFPLAERKSRPFVGAMQFARPACPNKSNSRT